MNRPGPETPPTPVEAALGEVLAAEGEAREAIAECRRRAEALTDAGRARARHIRARTEERIATLRGQADRSVKHRVAALGEETRALTTALVIDDAQRARLDRAIAALAAELTGGPP
jgi:vacuolar-type H+-ATPase subunit H